MPDIKRQIGLLCPPKEEAEVIEVDTQENNQDSIEGIYKNNSVERGMNASPMAQPAEKFMETGGATFDEQH